MRHAVSKLVLVLGLTTASGTTPQAPAPLVLHSSPVTQPVVARVNGVPLLEKDLEREMQRLFPYYSIHGGRVPAQKEPEIRKQALETIIVEEMVYQQAVRRKIKVPSAKIAARVRQARSQYALEEQFREAVLEAAGSERRWREQIRRALMVELLWNQQVMAPARVSEAEARRFYAENRRRYLRPEAVNLQTISLQVPIQATAAERERIRARAEKVLEEARSAPTPEAFGALAEKYSTDDWRVMNGSRGWVHRGALEEELNMAFRLAPGQVSGVIESSYGYHLLRVNGYRPERLPPFSEVRQAVTGYLIDRLRKKNQEAFVRQLKAAAKIER